MSEPSIQVEVVGHTCVLSLSGEFDVATVRVVWDEAVTAAAASTLPVVVDTLGVEFMDSMGLRLLVDLNNHAEGGITVRSASRRLLRLLQVTGLSTVFGVEDAQPSQ